MREVLPAIWTWEGREARYPRPERGYFVAGAACLVDPPYLADGTLASLPSDARPRAVLLTDHFHVRSAPAWCDEGGCEVWLHRDERDWTDARIDHWFDDGDTLLERFRVIQIPNSFFFGESAFLWERAGGVLFVGDAVRGRDGRSLWLTGTRYLRRTGSSAADAVEGLKVLLDYEFDALLPSHGPPVLTGAKDALAQFIVSPILLDQVPPDAI